LTDSFALVSTGSLPSGEVVAGVLDEAYERFRHVTSGEVADYIPALARADPNAFGACVVSADGHMVSAGDVSTAFSIQSVSKPFVFALVCEAIGGPTAGDLLGVNSTGMPFNSVMAVELSEHRRANPMANAGAIAATSLVPGSTAEAKWDRIVDGLSGFAGRRLEIDVEVYESETRTNLRNRGIAHLMESYDRLWFEPDESTDVYTRQCSLLVTAEDLAVMGATLADGGVNPRTGEQVVSAATCTRVLAVMVTAGMYERSGEWLYAVGLPGKSGVSGGMVTVAPGKGGLGTYSPPLDEAGNSVRGAMLTTYLSQRMGLNLFASSAVSPPR